LQANLVVRAIARVAESAKKKNRNHPNPESSNPPA
jgi:hypothetical protein